MIRVDLTFLCESCGKVITDTFTTNNPDEVMSELLENHYPLPDDWVWESCCSEACYDKLNGNITGEK
jgi:hypothetical protein